MQGHFHIACGVDPNGRTHLTHREINAPFHLSRPYWDGHALIVQAVHVAAGVFAGDTLSLRARVPSRARLLLTSPSAQRIHTMPAGIAATAQEFHIESEGWLETWPEWFIPQRDCHHRQTTHIHVAGGGEAYLVETLTPGRTAHGEWFDFRRLEWETLLHYDGHLVVCERASLTGPQCRDRLRLPGSSHRPGAYYAVIHIVTPRNLPLRDLQTALHTSSPDAWTGLTRLHDHVYAVRILTPGSQALRNALAHVRNLFQTHLPPLQANPRKL
ncbi:MAG TPA: urease accessory protein UreD [Kiritimatiellia bacterium]|nr:urease accessory protein UreD [Kiritimatiellia bacterium]